MILYVGVVIRFLRMTIKNGTGKCPHCGIFIPAVIWENYRLRKNGESDMLDAIHDVLADWKPLFSGAC